MNSEIFVIAGTAATIGFVHTALGPDHYLPFIVIGKARNWSFAKTLIISFFCGLGHVLSSVVLGFVGIGLGIAVFRLENIESFREGIAAWLLVGFGFIYFLWGMYVAIKNKPHRHLHPHTPTEDEGHSHSHEKKESNLTPWVLLAIFIFGPCKPLIPMIMYPASQHSIGGVILVATAFGITTLVTMLVIIALAYWGIQFVNLGKLERYTHAMAGAMIFLSGLAVQFLGI